MTAIAVTLAALVALSVATSLLVIGLAIYVDWRMDRQEAGE